MVIYTGRFFERYTAEVVPVAISVGKPKGFSGESLGLLAPWGIFRRLRGEAFRLAYREALERAGVERIRRALNAISSRHGGADLVLLCWEDVSKGASCHRRIFAEWWEEKTGERVEELTPLEEGERPAVLQLRLM